MIAGRYSLVREVGRGGMGAVWLGRDELLHRQVALKRVGSTPDTTDSDLARAEREARLAASLNHPHVVAIYDLVHEGDQRWLVMEYVEGESLASLVRREGALPRDRVGPLIRQAAEALAAAHAGGIVHRDVKPSNMMVSPSDQVKIADFGIARATADATLTQTGLVTGSPAYLAPEVATGKKATDRSDVWSLGATLYHALSGRPPYDVGDNVMGALYRIVHESPPRLPDAGWLAPVLEATMATDPSQRWSMREVAHFLGGGPAPATRITAPMPLVTDDAATQAIDPLVTAQQEAAPHEVSRSEPASAPVAPPKASQPSQPDQPREISATKKPKATEPRKPRDPKTSGGPSRALLILLTAAVALLAVIAYRQLTGGTGDDPTAAPSSPTATAEATESPSPSPTEKTPDVQEQAQAMEDFASDYLSTVTSDPESTWQRLTPAFQQQSGGFSSYSNFWSSIRSAEVLEISADPEANTVTYSVTYTRKNGSTTTDNVTLQLRESGDSFLISGES